MNGFYLYTLVVNLTIALLLFVGCAEQTTTIGDLYVEAWTALQAYKHGNYYYIPANNKISVATRKADTQFRVISIGFVQNRKMALHLTYPNEWVIKDGNSLNGANKEFESLRRCVDKVTSGTAGPMDSCATSILILNGENGIVVRDIIHAPHMDVWMYNVD